jgi:hypothetical protein
MFDKLRAALDSCETRVLAFDPGETTGVACIQNGCVLRYDQVVTKPVGPGAFILADIIELAEPAILICEDYKVYSWKSNEHKWASIHTLRLIGAIEYICHMRALQLHLEMAQVPKEFMTDDKLRGLGLYLTGKPHARDAMRHAVWYSLFKIVSVQQLNGGVNVK